MKYLQQIEWFRGFNGQRGSIQQVTEDYEKFVRCPKSFLDCLSEGKKRKCQMTKKAK